MTTPSVNQTVVITERSWNPQRTTYDYSARGIAAYSETAVASYGDAPDVTPTAPQQAKDLADTGMVGSSSAVGVALNAVAPTDRSSIVYMGHMSGDRGQGFYIKEWNGVSWEVRAKMAMRDSSYWLVVDDMSLGMSMANVGLS